MNAEAAESLRKAGWVSFKCRDARGRSYLQLWHEGSKSWMDVYRVGGSARITEERGTTNMLRTLIVAFALLLPSCSGGFFNPDLTGVRWRCNGDGRPDDCPTDDGTTCRGAIRGAPLSGWCLFPWDPDRPLDPAPDGGTPPPQPDLAEPPPCAPGARATQLGANAVGCHGAFEVGKMAERCGAWRVCGQWDAAEIDFETCEKVAGSLFYAAAFVRPEPPDENKYPPPKIHCGDWSDGKGGVANNPALLSCGGRMGGVTVPLPKSAQIESCPDNILRFARITACGMAPSSPGCTFTPNPTPLNVGGVNPNDAVLCCRPKK